MDSVLPTTPEVFKTFRKSEEFDAILCQYLPSAPIGNLCLLWNLYALLVLSRLWLDFPEYRSCIEVKPDYHHLELGRQWKVIIFHIYFVKRRIRILRLKICMEMILENFTRKTYYDYFQVYDITLIYSLFVRILYFNYMLYYKKYV
jgi:hypothetical protein